MTNLQKSNIAWELRKYQKETYRRSRIGYSIQHDTRYGDKYLLIRRHVGNAEYQIWVPWDKKGRTKIERTIRTYERDVHAGFGVLSETSQRTETIPQKALAKEDLDMLKLAKQYIEEQQ